MQALLHRNIIPIHSHHSHGLHRRQDQRRDPGLGENIRGTILGTVDTVAHEGENEGNAIAQRGREEMSAGMATMGRPAPAANPPYADARAPTTSGNTNQGTFATLEQV
ncbi:hypothetical protein BDZ89DRAFT_377475 [Hymenopellis radicata]|nr:hypothetical protein BDZ89DRAFT_377475 [Hymenopellis radicata]